MAENDLSRIIGLIMENPRLVEEIRNLAKDKGGSEENCESEAEQTSAEDSVPVVSGSTYPLNENDSRVRRKDLLMALKPYVSEERGRAIESMMSIADIIDIMRSK